VYGPAGFEFLCLPVADGGAPTFEQAREFVRFVTQQRAKRQPVAVHCEAGLGRTGTLIACYLISEGDDAASAIQKVCNVERVAIESPGQILFLEQLSKRVHGDAERARKFCL
jgi:atypical dual specificity phosphatase